jgi:hypothetical protein
MKIKDQFQRVKRLFQDKGFRLCLVLSVFCLSLFFGKLLVHPNSVYFNSKGDGMLVYYNSIWHVKNDPSFIKETSMNYPYGENVFFTACQAPITNTIKLVSKVIDISDYTVGITNLVMLLSIVLCAIFLYLVFKELKVHYVFAAVCATAIAFLSPQIDRLASHYVLTYEFAIPAFLFLLIKFWQQPSLKRSIVIALLAFFMAFIQLYFFVFFALISLFYWLILFAMRDRGFGRISFVLKHFIIQIILPFAFLQVILFFANHVNDRTAIPWGFFEYTSSWEGVFFPFKMPYKDVVKQFYAPGNVEWEGLAYIGLGGVITFLLVSLGFLKKLLNFQFSALLRPTDNRLLNIFFWAGLMAMFYSFAYPFIWTPFRGIVDHLSFLRQIRAIGRFAWIFYYVINIVAVYLAYNWVKNKNLYFRYSFLALVAALFCYDAWMNVRNFQNDHNNELPQLTDVGNKLPEDQWINNISCKAYQAIIPLPYLHIGSENVDFIPEGNIEKYLYIVSLKTKLPTIAFRASRASLSQTYKNISLFLEPDLMPGILNDLPDKRPFLVLVDEAHMKPTERKVLDVSKFLARTEVYSVYSLNLEDLRSLYADKKAQAFEEFQKAKKFSQEAGVFSSDSIPHYLRLHYDETNNPQALFGSGAKECAVRDYCVAYEGPLPFAVTDTDYVFSLWMKDFKKDVYPRMTIEIATMDSLGKVYKWDYASPAALLKKFYKDWALLEGRFRFRSAKDKVKITFWSLEIPVKNTLVLDEFLARPAGDTIYESSPERLLINNRIYTK